MIKTSAAAALFNRNGFAPDESHYKHKARPMSDNEFPIGDLRLPICAASRDEWGARFRQIQEMEVTFIARKLNGFKPSVA